MNIDKMVKEGLIGEIERCQGDAYENIKLDFDEIDLHDFILCFARYEERMMMENNEVYEHFCKLLKKVDLKEAQKLLSDYWYNGY